MVRRARAAYGACAPTGARTVLNAGGGHTRITGNPQLLQPHPSSPGEIPLFPGAWPTSGKEQQRPWLLVAEGFHSRGGMDKANAALAKYLVSLGVPVHLVAFSIDRDLGNQSGISCTSLRISGRWPVLGRFVLAWRGRSTALKLTSHSRNAC